MYDVAIIGAGPSGLIAAYELQNLGMNFIVLEKGRKLDQREKFNPYDVSFGFGGAGLFSDGKVSYPPSGSGLWNNFDETTLKSAYESIYALLNELELPIKKWNNDWLKRQVVDKKIKNYYSDYWNKDNREKLLNNINSRIGTSMIHKEVKKIEKYSHKFTLTCTDNSCFESKFVIVACGKASSATLFDESELKKWQTMYEMGVRIESNSESLDFKDSTTLDYKKIKKIDEKNELRTFCFCKRGTVIKSRYLEHDTFNGDGDVPDSPNGNMGVLLKSHDENSEYVYEFKEAYSRNNSLEMSFQDFTNEGIMIGKKTDAKLIEFIYGLSIEGDIKVQGPEIERYGLYPELRADLSSSTGLYFTGDTTGLFRGILTAMVSGSFVAKKIHFAHLIDNVNLTHSNTNSMNLIFTAQSKKVFYCRDVICEFVLKQKCLPLNPFRVFDYFLGDRVGRDIIRQGNNQLVNSCDEIWIFGEISNGVMFEIILAIQLNKKIRFFSVGTICDEIHEIELSQIVFEKELAYDSNQEENLKLILDYIKTERYS